jgi:hypothetical protein
VVLLKLCLYVIIQKAIYKPSSHFLCNMLNFLINAEYIRDYSHFDGIGEYMAPLDCNLLILVATTAGLPNGICGWGCFVAHASTNLIIKHSNT